MLERLEEQVRAHIQQAREQRGDVAMGCVRLEAGAGFVGIVYDKPGGSSAQFEVMHDPERGYVVMSPEGEQIIERDPEALYQRFAAVIESIPEERRTAIVQKIEEWKAQGYQGARLYGLVVGFNAHYQGTRGGELTAEEVRYAAQVAAS